SWTAFSAWANFFLVSLDTLAAFLRTSSARWLARHASEGLPAVSTEAIITAPINERFLNTLLRRWDVPSLVEVSADWYCTNPLIAVVPSSTDADRRGSLLSARAEAASTWAAAMPWATWA